RAHGHEHEHGRGHVVRRSDVPVQLPVPPAAAGLRRAREADPRRARAEDRLRGRVPKDGPRAGLAAVRVLGVAGYEPAEGRELASLEGVDMDLGMISRI